MAEHHAAADPAFSPEAMRQARLAANDERALVEVLEEHSGLDAASFVQALGRKMRYPVLDMAALNGLAPAFDALPFALALQRECLALRDGFRGLRLVTSDPFDTRLCAWAEQQISEEFSWCLAHRADIAAYLGRYEETLRVMDSMPVLDDQGASARDGIEQLSFKSISEDTSPVVKLVHSTVYDALRAGASDIHLESGGAGLTIKYPNPPLLRRVQLKLR